MCLQGVAANGLIKYIIAQHAPFKKITNDRKSDSKRSERERKRETSLLPHYRPQIMWLILLLNIFIHSDNKEKSPLQNCFSKYHKN